MTDSASSAVCPTGEPCGGALSLPRVWRAGLDPRGEPIEQYRVLDDRCRWTHDYLRHTGMPAAWFTITTHVLGILALTVAALVNVLVLRALAARRQATR